MSRRLKIAAAAAGGTLLVLVVLVVVVLANLTGVVRAFLEKEVPGLTFKSLDVGWNKVAISGVTLKRGARTVFKVDALRVYPSMWSIFSDTLHVARIEIDAPYVYLVRNADGSLTLPVPEGMDRTESKRPAKQKTAPKEETDRRKVRIDRIRIHEGKGDLVDRSVSGPAAQLTLSRLEVSVEKVTVPVGRDRIPFEVSARLEAKRPGTLRADGWYEAATRSAEVDLALEELFVPKAEPYFRGRHTTAALGDGVLALDADLEMKEGRYVARAAVSLKDLTFAREGLFLGLPTPVFRKLVNDGKKPLEVETELKGSLEDREGLQRQLLEAVVKAAAKQAAEQGLGAFTVDQAASKAGEVMDQLFGR